MHDDRWRPLVEGAHAERARAAIQAISDALRRPYGDWRLTRIDDGSGVRTLSLASGRSGVALFYDYLWRWSGLDEHAELAARTIDETVDGMGQAALSASLYGGFPGIAWLIQHAQPPSSEDDDPNSDIDDLLAARLVDAPWEEGIDLIDGLAGIIVYLVERLPRAPALRGIEAAVAQLERLAEVREDGITWPWPVGAGVEGEAPRPRYNLGMSHGVPGLIAALALAYRKGAAMERSKHLLEGAVTWLWAQERPRDAPYAFGHYAGSVSPDASYRSAWCYGDPGVAAALLQAARALGNADWERRALNIARRAVSFPPEQSGVIDAGLCHGAAGLCHIFHRFYNSEGDEVFGQAARFWLERTLDLRRPGAGIAGYRAWGYELANGQGSWEDDPCWLTGAAGIGLVLLAATTDIEPAWDRVMLLDIPTSLR